MSNAAETTELVGEERTASFEPETNTLTLTENETGDVVLAAEWNEEEAVWEDKGSNLTEEDRDKIATRAEEISLPEQAPSGLER